MASAEFTINGATNPGLHVVTYNSFVQLALVSTHGISTCSFAIVGVSKSDQSYPAITLSGTPFGTSASFRMPVDPGDGLGRSFLIKATAITVEGREITATGLVGAVNAFNIIPIASGEKLERDGTHGWIDAVNQGPIASASSFVSLSDTPGALAGAGGKSVRVNSGESALEFVSSDPVEQAATLAALRDVSPLAGALLSCKGRGTAGDELGLLYRYIPGSAPGTWSDDGGLTIVPTGGDGSARWAPEEFHGLALCRPEAFGARGDDTTDDLTAIQAAATALGALGGGVLYLTRKYRVSGTVTLSSNTTVRFSSRSATITSTGTSKDIFHASGASNITIERGSLIGNNSGVGGGADGDLGMAASFVQCSNITIRDCYANGFGTPDPERDDVPSVSTSVFSAKQTVGFEVSSCWLGPTSYSVTGFDVDAAYGVSDLRVINNVSVSQMDGGVITSSVTYEADRSDVIRHTITGNIFIRPVGSYCRSGIMTYGHRADMAITGNVIQGFAWNGIYANASTVAGYSYPSGGYTITGNVVLNCGGRGGITAGIFVVGRAGTSVVGNVIRDCGYEANGTERPKDGYLGARGIKVIGPSRDITIADNEIFGCNYVGIELSHPGGVAYDFDGIHIHDCTVRDCVTSGIQVSYEGNPTGMSGIHIHDCYVNQSIDGAHGVTLATTGSTGGASNVWDMRIHDLTLVSTATSPGHGLRGQTFEKFAGEIDGLTIRGFDSGVFESVRTENGRDLFDRLRIGGIDIHDCATGITGYSTFQLFALGATFTNCTADTSGAVYTARVCGVTDGAYRLEVDSSSAPASGTWREGDRVRNTGAGDRTVRTWIRTDSAAWREESADEYLRPEAYGDVDSAASTAIQAALTAATGSSTPIVELGARSYSLASVVTIPSGVELRGLGPATVLTWTGGAVAGVVSATSATNSKLSNLTIDCGGVDAGAVVLSNCTDCEVTSVRARNATGLTRSVFVDSGSTGSAFVDVRVANDVVPAASNPSADVYITGNKSRSALVRSVSTMNAGIVIESGDAKQVHSVVDCRLLRADSPLATGFGVKAGTGNGALQLTMSGCLIEGFGGGGAQVLTGASGGTIERGGATISGNTFRYVSGNYPSYGLFLSGSQIAATGNRLEWIGWDSDETTRRAAPGEAIVVRNRCRGVNISGNSIYKAIGGGIYTEASAGLYVDGLTISGNSITYHELKALYFGAQAADAKIRNLIVSGNATLSDHNSAGSSGLQLNPLNGGTISGRISDNEFASLHALGSAMAIAACECDVSDNTTDGFQFGIAVSNGISDRYIGDTMIFAGNTHRNCATALSASTMGLVYDASFVGVTTITTGFLLPAVRRPPNGSGQQTALVLTAAAPSTGLWRTCDVADNTAPAIGSPQGWVCTAGGTPGTWAAKPNL